MWLADRPRTLILYTSCQYDSQLHGKWSCASDLAGFQCLYGVFWAVPWGHDYTMDCLWDTDMMNWMPRKRTWRLKEVFRSISYALFMFHSDLYTSRRASFPSTYKLMLMGIWMRKAAYSVIIFSVTRLCLMAESGYKWTLGFDALMSIVDCKWTCLSSSLWHSSLGNIHDYLISPGSPQIGARDTPEPPLAIRNDATTFFFTLFWFPSLIYPFPCSLVWPWFKYIMSFS